MPAISTRSSNPHRLMHLGTCLGAAAIAAAPLVVMQGTADAATPVIKSANVPNYAGVLENHASHTLYALSIEKGAKLHCTSAACLSTWAPLLVPSSSTTVAVASTVKGKIGFVARSKTQKQVTVNTYPVYTYKGDVGPNQSNGEAIAADGGTWSMLHAAAKTAAGTPVAPLLQSGSFSPYANVLQNSSRYTLYVLTAEKGGTLHCTGACLQTWFPLYVTSSTTKIAKGLGVKGAIGFVTRGSSKQVTINSYPVYTYYGDSGRSQSNGEDIPADGGTWYMASAAATTAAATPILPK
jgi:predicted lipoprotein with Yx(FWY)xxD motif